MPALNDAMKALNTVTKKDLDEVRSFTNPPAPVKVVMEAVCIMVGQKPARTKDSAGRMVDDYWTVSKQLLGQVSVIHALITHQVHRKCVLRPRHCTYVPSHAAVESDSKRCD